MITLDLMLREELDQRGIVMETLQHVFPLHQAHPPPTPLASAQGPLSPSVLGASQMLDSLGEAQMVVDLPDTPEIVVVTMEGFDGHLEEEDDPEED